MASGSVSDYADTSALRTNVAKLAGVESTLVDISVAAASVLITATIAVPASSTASAVQTALSDSLATAAAASDALGIPVESTPTVALGSSVSTSASPPPAKTTSEGGGGGGDNTVVIAAGAGGGGAVLLLLVLVFVYYRKRIKGQRHPKVMTRPSAGPEKAQGAISIVEHTPIVSLNSEGTGASDGGPDAQRVPLAKAAREAQKMRSASALLNDWKLSPQDLSYDENKKLGRGGQADVCIGKWKGSTVAVKRVRENTQAVRREVRALTRVRHPNVVRLYGACMDPPKPCLVMAYAEGGTLQEAIDAGRVDSNSEHLRVLVGIARGMEAVHAQKLVHLDLKPENVLLAADGTPWVTDFGLSISTNKGSESVIRGRGTLRYKAPELFSDQTPTPAVDVYAFAILAWVMITREEPFSEVQSIDTSLSFHLEKGKRPSLANGHDWRAATAPNLSKIVEACWAQEQSERPPFGGDGGVLQMLVDLESRLPRKTDDKALVRLLSAECDAKTTEGRIKELEQADASAAAGLKEELKEEREGEMVTLQRCQEMVQRCQEMVQQAAQAAQAAQETGAIVVEKLELFHRESEQSLDEIKRAVHAGNVTLEQMARGELDCPRLVFIFPAPRVEGRTLAGRLADKIPNLQDKYRLVFLDPVTGSAVPTGKDGKGYELKMPADWLLKHGKKLESGLAIVKLGLAVGRLAGLPLPDLDELGVMPREGQIMAEARAVKAFEAVIDGAATSAGTEESVTSTRQSRSSRVSARGTPAEAATGMAYRALKELISTQCEDPNLLHCGLQKERADDGTVEWVAPESKDHFIKEGAACLIWVEE